MYQGRAELLCPSRGIRKVPLTDISTASAADRQRHQTEVSFSCLLGDFVRRRPSRSSSLAAEARNKNAAIVWRTISSPHEKARTSSKLHSELRDLEFTGFDLGLIGFEPDQLQNFRESGLSIQFFATASVSHSSCGHLARRCWRSLRLVRRE
jgi:hypothetical protein